MRRPGLQQPESLEPRRVLAGVVTIIDVDGEVATLRSSRGSSADLIGAITTFASGLGTQIAKIDLSSPVFAGTKLQITITQSLLGGDGAVNIGEIFSPHDLSSVTVSGDLAKITVGDGTLTTPGIGRLSLRSMGEFSTATGAPDLTSTVFGSIGSLSIQGNMRGASFNASDNIGKATIGGSIIGVNSGDGFTAGSIGTMTVAGSLEGGGTTQSGQIFTNRGAIRSLRIGQINGGAGNASGIVSGLTGIREIRVTLGSVNGGTGQYSGGISAGPAGGIGTLSIVGSLIGNSVADTGYVTTQGRIRSATIGGFVVGGAGQRSGFVEGRTGIDSIRIGVGLAGGANLLSGSVSAPNGAIRRLDVGSITGGTGQASGAVIAGSLGAVTVRGDVRGLPSNPVVMSANGASGRAIGSLTVQGNVEHALVLGGYLADTPINGNARIGDVVIRGNLFASSIVAGITNAVFGRFGDLGDSPIGGFGTSRIDSVTVGGTAVGTGTAPDAFGISAMTIGSVRIGGTRYIATPGFPVSPLGDNFAIHDLL